MAFFIYLFRGRVEGMKVRNKRIRETEENEKRDSLSDRKEGYYGIERQSESDRKEGDYGIDRETDSQRVTDSKYIFS